MGCDIHTYVEIKKTINGEKKWVSADVFKFNPYYLEDNEYEINEYEIVHICDTRNYSLFATLANVRNYGNTCYISEPKGLPNDVSDFVRKEYEEEKWDAHSCSYFTLKELIEAQESMPPLKHRGMISPEDQLLLDEKGILPKEWCQGTNRKDWQWREWEEPNKVLIPIINALKQRGYDFYLFWDEDDVLTKADQIRFVFWFDN